MSVTPTPAGVHAALRELERMSNGVGPTSRAVLEQLRADASTDIFTIAVLGEFKRGKSTLVNALLCNDLLPTDVTPTTAVITVVRHSDRPKLTVHWADGTEEDRAFHQTALREFSVGEAFDPEALDYLEVGLPNDLLREGVAIVDTPGVDDLSQHRTDVVCRFVPRCDAILFVVSSASPVRKSEMDFLETQVLASGHDRIIFVANFADLVDEDEREDISKVVSRRLATAFDGVAPRVSVVSGRTALEAVQSGDRDLLEESGLPELQKGISALISAEERRRTKERRLLNRAKLCARAFASDLERTVALCDRDVESLRGDLQRIDCALGEKAERRTRLRSWLEDRKVEVLAIVRKSLLHFEEHATETILEAVEEYRGTDFKDFVERRIPGLLQKQSKMWIEAHTAPMTALLSQVDSRLVSALSQEFESHVPRIREERAVRLQAMDSLSLSGDDVSGASVRAGLFAGAAAGALVLLGAPILVPIVGMAAYPLLSKSLTEQQLRAAKDKIKPELESGLNDAFRRFENAVVSAMRQNMDVLLETAEARFDDLMIELRSRVQEHIDERTLGGSGLQEAREQATVAHESATELEKSLELALGLEGGGA